MSDFLQQNLPIIMQVLGVAIMFGVSWLIKKAITRWNNNEALVTALEALKVGVKDTYENYVRDLKNKAADGKLTDEERRTARTMAINKAVEIVKGPGAKVLNEAAREELDAWINKIVNKEKKDASTSSNNTATTS